MVCIINMAMKGIKISDSFRMSVVIENSGSELLQFFFSSSRRQSFIKWLKTLNQSVQLNNKLMTEINPHNSFGKMGIQWM